VSGKILFLFFIVIIIEPSVLHQIDFQLAFPNNVNYYPYHSQLSSKSVIFG